MRSFKHIFGPVPSRRMGSSLGVSPLPDGTCNYSCVYCQLGRTRRMINDRRKFFPLEKIIDEFKKHHNKNNYDVVTVVGEGEPTLYSRLGDLLIELKKLTDKPVAVITNGSLLYREDTQKELMNADIVLPSLDSWNKQLFKKINRPHGKLDYETVYNGLVTFSNLYKGQLFLEIMLMKGINDDDESLEKFAEIIKNIRYDRLYINTPVRPPAELNVSVCDKETIEKAVKYLGGISIEMLAEGSFSSDIEDDYEAILSIIGRHPMNQFEIKSFADSRKNCDAKEITEKLNNDSNTVKTEYKGYVTYRLKY
ncbi:MAG: radical SAM protein [Candidatus Cloacimonadota bacterium]|nr:MAG: radical SAM protein [Candidatus Cloacimonadota bacterium]